MTKQTKNQYRPPLSSLKTAIQHGIDSEEQETKIIQIFRHYVKKGANPSDVLSRYLVALRDYEVNGIKLFKGQKIRNHYQLGRIFEHARDCYKLAYVEQGYTLKPDGNANLEKGVSKWTVEKTPARTASTPAAPKNKQGETPQQTAKRQADVLHDVMPFATGLSTGKLKKALSDTDKVSAIVMAARIIEAATGSHAVFSAVLNEYTEQKKTGGKRTLKVA